MQNGTVVRLNNMFREIVNFIFNNNKNYCTFFFKGDWNHCCWQHDLECILAIEYLSPKMRLEADKKLRDCVKAKNHPYISKIMYIGVRAWANTFWWGLIVREYLEMRFKHD